MLGRENYLENELFSPTLEYFESTREYQTAFTL